MTWFDAPAPLFPEIVALHGKWLGDKPALVDGERTLCSLGLYSNISWAGFLCTLLAGGTVVVMRSFEPRAPLEVVERERITHGAMVPVQFQRILELPDFDRYGVGSLRSLMCCGLPLAPELKAEAIRRLDEEGFLYIVDRKKDLILSGSQNVYPGDIELVAVRHPDVAEVAVVGVPSERWGETPLAVIVPRAGATPDAAQLAVWINERVGRQQRVTGVVLRDSLPRNPNGKILKRELRADYARFEAEQRRKP